jgi:hypothetical protein
MAAPPLAGRLSARVGETPVLRVTASPGHCWITTDGRLVMTGQDRLFQGARCRLRCVAFAGTILVIWDGASMHRGQAVNDVSAGNPGELGQAEEPLGS